VTGIELIMAALAAGAGTGVSDAAKTAVLDAYNGLRDVLRRRLAGHHRAVEVLDAGQTDLREWQARLGVELAATGADHDDDILAAAHRLLKLADPSGAPAGKYDLDLRGSQQPQVGDNSVRIGVSYGPVAGSMTGSVAVTYPGQPPVPPTQPGA
jgi:hypothetical protein